MARVLKDAVIVVTGASSGIGRETALQLAKAGAKVVLAARREEPLQDLEAKIRAEGGEAIAVPTDMSILREVEALADRAVEQFGRIDGWVNDAGVYALGSLEEMPIDVFRRVMDVNYFGVVYGTRAAARQMKKQDSGGVVVNVSSEAGSVSIANTAAYAASKHAVRGFTSAVRQEYLGSGIEISNVMPPGVDTPLFEHGANFTGQQMKAPEPVYPPEKVAQVIVRMLVKPEADTYVGAVAPVMGAFRHMAPSAFDRFGRVQSKGHVRKEHQEPTAGNLYSTVAHGAGVHGGQHGMAKHWGRKIALLTTLGVGSFSVSRAIRRHGPSHG